MSDRALPVPGLQGDYHSTDTGDEYSLVATGADFQEEAGGGGGGGGGSTGQFAVTVICG